MREFGRRSGAGTGDRNTGDAASPFAPGHRTLVEALDVAPAVAPRGVGSGVDAVQLAPQPGASPAPDAAGAAAGPLSPVEVAAAIQFHTAQPWKYTPEVVTDIQGAVGVPPTGKMNAATVQAIAARQAAVNADRKPTPPLKVDGKAGPRTLPILRPVGLATDASIDKYTADIGGMKDELDKAEPAERARLLMKELNDRLDAVGVPRITQPAVIDAHLSAFASETWTMTISETALADPKGAAATMYHEARHAEQSYRIARMLAGKKRSEAQLVVETPIEATIAARAFAQPLAPGTTEAVEAEGWHDDEVGRPTQAQQRARSKVVFDEFLAAARTFKKEPTPANRKRAETAYEAWKDVYYVHDYRDRPHEFDAFLVGEKVGDKLGVPRESFLPFDEVVAKIPES